MSPPLRATSIKRRVCSVIVRLNGCKGSADSVTDPGLWYTIFILTVVTRVGQTQMRAVVQRVSRAQVTVIDESVGAIEAGLLLLLGGGRSDTEGDASTSPKKSLGCGSSKMNVGK